MIVGIDGRDGEGKSRLGRFLAWRLEMPCVETDTFLQVRTGSYAVRRDDLRRVVRTRLDLDRPVIVEGMFLLRTLQQIGEKPDVLVYVQKEPPHESAFERELEEYREHFDAGKLATHRYVWNDEGG